MSGSANRKRTRSCSYWGWLSADLAARMQALAGFRNLLVHGYAKVDPRILRDIVLNRLDDLLGFVAGIRHRLAQSN